MHRSNLGLGLGGIVAGLLLAGCSLPPEPTEPTVTRVTAETPEACDRLWNSIADTLRRNYFRIDRSDRMEGVVTTHPEVTAQFFELWRPQPTPAYYWAESNLQTTPLQVKVTLKPAEGEGAYNLAVQVERMRYILVERQIDNSAAAMRLYSAEAPTVTTGKKEKPSETAQLTPLGRDKPAEEHLLKAIVDRYAKTPAVIEAGEEQAIAEQQTEITTTRPE